MVISNEEKRVTAYHEAGHTLVGLKVPNAIRCTRYNFPRGMALGVTQQLPEGVGTTTAKIFARPDCDSDGRPHC